MCIIYGNLSTINTPIMIICMIVPVHIYMYVLVVFVCTHVNVGFLCECIV